MNWEEEEGGVARSDWFDEKGCYSGSGVIEDGDMYVM
ncbi:hypothetical protein [Bacillus pumilus]|nr:hypothetical protein [Bacillus pumilus]